jgi:hypothetical protein
MAEELAQLYESLNFPSASVFYKALRRRGIAVQQADVVEFVKSRSERQVSAQPPKYDGNIVAFYINHRWVADLMAFTSRPAKGADGTYTHVLLVQDIFSRYLWAKPLKSVTETAPAFESILKDSGDRMVDAEPIPDRLDTDGGPEYANQAFRALVARYKIEHVIKEKHDYQALATLDRAMGVVKKMLQRRQEARGGTWLSNLDTTIEAYNNTEHGGIDAEPAQLTDDGIFSLKKQAAEGLQENTALLQKRKERLEKEGGYRTHQPKETKGLRRRIDANTWSRKVHQVDGFPEPGIVEDTEGNRTLTKFAKPVPEDSSALAARPRPRPPDNLQRFAVTLQTILPGRGATFTQAAKLMRKQPGFKDALSMARMSFAAFVRRFPSMVTIRDDRLYGGTQTTL